MILTFSSTEPAVHILLKIMKSAEISPSLPVAVSPLRLLVRNEDTRFVPPIRQAVSVCGAAPNTTYPQTPSQLFRF